MKKIIMKGDKIYVVGIDDNKLKHLVICERKTPFVPFEPLERYPDDLRKPILDIQFNEQKSLDNLIDVLQSLSLS